MTDEDQGRALLVALLEQQLDKGGPVVGVECRGGLVSDHQWRRADQRPRGGNPLLLADAEGMDGAMQRVVRQLQLRQQTARLLLRTPLQAGPFGGRKGEGSGHVVLHREKGQQIELLEDITQIGRPEVVTGTAREPGQWLAQHLQGAVVGGLDPGQQPEQGRLAGA